ncbi:MAG: M56 family metallopeptidase [Bacteroidota bacterium]
MSWLYYLLEANLYLVLFYCFYCLFLKNETFYSRNRYFLLLVTLFSFTLPILKIGWLKPTITTVQTAAVNEMFPPPILLTDTVRVVPEAALNLNDWLYAGYLLIALCFAIKLAINVYSIIWLWIKAKKNKVGKITLIEVNDDATAFSFFNLLFIHPALTDKPAVLKHEMVHIKQKHSFDILFFELIQIVCWFNPVLAFIKKDIKLLHEYIADELTTNNDVQKHEYALFLIQNSFGLRAQPITNHIFNQSILKRRINMLNKKRTAARARLRLLLALPLSGAMLCLSTMAFTKDYGYIDLLPEKSNAILIQQNPKPAAVKKDQIKYPAPPKTGKTYRPQLKYDKASGRLLSTEKKLIVINKVPLKNNKEFYGVADADEIVFLNNAAAIKKYGETEGKNGAIEITGKRVGRIFTPPVVVKQDQIKFPPPVVKPYSKDHFTPWIETNMSTGKAVVAERRLIVINGEAVENIASFYGVTHTDNVVYLDKQAALKKYGNRARLGAVEITGNSIEYIGTPPPKQDQIKFPPPIVKRDQIKFPPPMVKSISQKRFYPRYKVTAGTITLTDKRYIVINNEPVADNNKYYWVNDTESVFILSPVAARKKYGADKGKNGAVIITGTAVKILNQLPPSPPPPAKKEIKKDQIKFPPPVVKPDQKKPATKIIEGDPIKTAKLDEASSLIIKEALKREIELAKERALQRQR